MKSGKERVNETEKRNTVRALLKNAGKMATGKGFPNYCLYPLNNVLHHVMDNV